ncbi:MAG TPA: aspartyl protease family protein, partial [Flavisolibacter sp.]|nr:aspartyl protease family protein [Flavisolibacter sp.]
MVQLLRYICSSCVLCIIALQLHARAGVPLNHSAVANSKILSVSPLISIESYSLPGSDTTSCVIPFNRVGNLMLIKAKADSIEGSFILDSGAPGLVLNITYFRDYPVTNISDGEQTSITGSSYSVSKTSVKELSFGSLRYFQMEADLLNLGHIENSKGVRILGLLGVELFKQCEMIINFEKGLIYLHRIGRKEATKYRSELLNDTAAYHTFPIELKDNRIIATTEMDGKKLKLAIDCAAESNVLDSRLPDRIFEHFEITKRV